MEPVTSARLVLVVACEPPVMAVMVTGVQREVRARLGHRARVTVLSALMRGR